MWYSGRYMACMWVQEASLFLFRTKVWGSNLMPSVLFYLLGRVHQAKPLGVCCKNQGRPRSARSVDPMRQKTTTGKTRSQYINTNNVIMYYCYAVQGTEMTQTRKFRKKDHERVVY